MAASDERSHLIIDNSNEHQVIEMETSRHQASTAKQRLKGNKSWSLEQLKSILNNISLVVLLIATPLWIVAGLGGCLVNTRYVITSDEWNAHGWWRRATRIGAFVSHYVILPLISYFTIYHLKRGVKANDDSGSGTEMAGTRDSCPQNAGLRSRNRSTIKRDPRSDTSSHSDQITSATANDIEDASSKPIRVTSFLSTPHVMGIEERKKQHISGGLYLLVGFILILFAVSIVCAETRAVELFQSFNKTNLSGDSRKWLMSSLSITLCFHPLTGLVSCITLIMVIKVYLNRIDTILHLREELKGTRLNWKNEVYLQLSSLNLLLEKLQATELMRKWANRYGIYFTFDNVIYCASLYLYMHISDQEKNRLLWLWILTLSASVIPLFIIMAKTNSVAADLKPFLMRVQCLNDCEFEGDTAPELRLASAPLAETRGWHDLMEDLDKYVNIYGFPINLSILIPYVIQAVTWAIVSINEAHSQKMESSRTP